MTRQEIYQGLKAKGIFDTNGKDPLWQEAFKVYYQETRQRLSPSCGSCWPKLRNWLMK